MESSDILSRSCSIKRSRNDSSTFNDRNERPSKRQSPRNSLCYTSPPVTPRKSTRFRMSPGRKIITSFKNAFSQSKNAYQSPVSGDEDSPCLSIFSCNDSDSGTDAILDSPASINEGRDMYLNLEKPLISLKPSSDELMSSKLSHLTLKVNEQHLIFQIPEILSRILAFVDSDPNLPHEEPPVRRRPLSYEHALLIYQDEVKARQVWNDACSSSMKNSGNPCSGSKSENSLFSCLLVNKFWYQVALEVASTKLYFSSGNQWRSFVKQSQIQPIKRKVSNTSILIMHRISKAEQKDIDLIAPHVSGSLEWIEMYICPKIIPSSLMLSGSLLKKLVLPGAKHADDEFLNAVARSCPKLEVLDLRACEQISDQGVCSIAASCPELKTINLGRHSNGELITDLSLFALSRNRALETIGLAGCSISDRGLWEISVRCNESISRMSLNNCTLLTNNSIPKLLKHGFLPNLSVLEIRKIVNLTDLRPLVDFKKMKEAKGQAVLIEGCEVLEYRMREQEWKSSVSKSMVILNEISQWVNNTTDEDGDLSYNLLQDRKTSQYN